MTQIAETDSLTQLPNRDWFLAHLERAASSATARTHQMTLILADLDRFKEINDTCGYAAGDQALVTVGRVFRSLVRKPDAVARLGGTNSGSFCPRHPSRTEPSSRESSCKPFRQRGSSWPRD